MARFTLGSTPSTAAHRIEIAPMTTSSRRSQCSSYHRLRRATKAQGTRDPALFAAYGQPLWRDGFDMLHRNVMRFLIAVALDSATT
jgi:hypothetical protein